jgi:hypothetical protein
MTYGRLTTACTRRRWTRSRSAAGEADRYDQNHIEAWHQSRKVEEALGEANPGERQVKNKVYGRKDPVEVKTIGKLKGKRAFGDTEAIFWH